MRYFELAIFIMFGVAGLALVVGFFSIPFALNDSNVTFPTEYNTRILVNPDTPYNSEYIVANYEKQDSFVSFNNYYQSYVDLAWPSARSWFHVEGSKEVPSKNVKSITTRK